MTSPNTMMDPAADDTSILDKVIGSTMAESKELLGNPEDIQHRPRNAQGEFTTIAGETPGEIKGPGEWNQVADATPEELAALAAGQPITPPAVADGTEPVVDAEPVIPDGFAKLPALDPTKVQGFKVMDADGEIVPPDLKFEVNFRDKTTGESKPQTLDLPQLVNYARMGRYNHEREQVYEQSTRDLQAWQNAGPRFEQAIKDRDARYERAMSDPQFLASELQRYDTENTPEARADRERLKLEDDRQQFEFQKVVQQSESYINDRLAPALEKIATQFPTVSRDELAAKLLLAADPFRVNGGVLHPKGFQHVASYIVRELYPWAEHAHTGRSSEQTTDKAPTKEPVKPVEKEQVRQQKQKRIGVAPMKPPTGQPQGGPQHQKPPRTNRDMEELVVGNSLAAMTGR